MRPVVLCFSGLDPSGGAGLQADIEAIGAAGAHAAVVCTALTHQDSQRVYGFECANSALVVKQAASILADLPVKAFKLGMMGSAEMVHAVFSVIRQHPHIPVVMDPVLAANSGDTLAQEGLLSALREQLALTTVITPNTLELQRLASSNDAAMAIANLPAHAIWVTGGHTPGEWLSNRLYVQGTLLHESRIPRLAGEFHGSGCTAASALAAYLALGHTLPEAVQLAERLVSQALQLADRPHETGQYIPNRMILRENQHPAVSGLYAITDASQGDGMLHQVETVLQAGVRWLQYRDKSTHAGRRLGQARELLRLCQHYGAALLINDDLELAANAGAHGVHLGQQDAALATARARLGSSAIIGVTCHDRLDLALRAQASGASYVAFGAMFGSTSKPEATRCPLSRLREAKAQLSIPVVAIGGITPDNVADVSRAGADAVAVISALWQAPSPFQQAQLFLREIYQNDH